VTASPRLLLSAALNIYVLAIVAYVIFAWLPAEHRRYRIYAFLEKIVDPVLRPIRSVLPPLGGWDIAPVVAIVLLHLLGRAILPHLPG
jgi:YggT family protein